MNSKFNIIWLLFFLLFSSCNKKESTLDNDKKQFFDLKEYFNREEQRLRLEVAKVRKIVLTGVVKEEHILDSIDFKRELSVFANSDINRPAWSNKYIVDSTFNDKKELVDIGYQSVDKDIKPHKITIEFKEASIASIRVENHASGLVATSSQFLTYRPISGYTIESFQQVLWSTKQVFGVEVEFLN